MNRSNNANRPPDPTPIDPLEAARRIVSEAASVRGDWTVSEVTRGLGPNRLRGYRADRNPWWFVVTVIDGETLEWAAHGPHGDEGGTWNDLSAEGVGAAEGAATNWAMNVFASAAATN